VHKRTQSFIIYTIVYVFLLVDKSEKTKSHQGERNFRKETAKQEKKIERFLG